MQETKKYDVDIDYYASCRGVWLDRGEIDKIASVQSRYEDEHYKKYRYSRRDYDDDDDMIITVDSGGKEADF
jgi:uncharacterized protein